MAKLKKLTPFLLLFFYAAATLYMFRERLGTQETYNDLVQQARTYAQDGIVVDAMENYRSALEVRPSLELELEAGQVFLDGEEYYDARNWYEDELLSKYPESPETYAYGIEACIELNDYEEAFQCYKKFCHRKLSDERVESLMNRIRYSFEVVNTYEEVSVFSNLSHTAAVRQDGLWGYVDTTGHRTLEYRYAKAGPFSETAPVVDEDGTARYIDAEGNTRYNGGQIERTDPAFGAVEEFQSICSNLILAFNGSEWAYFHTDGFQRAFDAAYPNALPIVDGTGAVQDGMGKWALIHEDGSTTDFRFDEVVADPKGILNRTGSIFVKIGEEYRLVDAQGNPVSEQSYSDVCAYYDETCAAVQRGGTWMFVDALGKELPLEGYDEARSFSSGLAAVRKGSQWGYINLEGELVIPCQFDEAGPFSDDGSAFVFHQGHGWDLIRLYKHND